MSLRATQSLPLDLFVLAGLAGLDRAAAQSPAGLPDTVDAYGIVFDQWVKDREPKTAILVVRRGGKTVFAKGYGADPHETDADREPVEGDHRRLRRDAGPRRQAQLHHAAPRCDAAVLQAIWRAGRSSVSIRRRSRNCWRIAPGLRGNADDDSIYGIFAKRASGGHGWQSPRRRPVLSEYLLKDRLARHPGGRYSYSNTGYEILTAIIEEQTGQLLRGLLRRGGVRQARHRRAEAASRLADAGGRGRLVHSRVRTIWPSSTSSIRPTRFSATPSKPGSTRRRNAGPRPTRTAGTASA